MSAPAPVSSPSDTLRSLKEQANFSAAMAQFLFWGWQTAHDKLLLLAQCARYEFFAKNPYQVNALILKDMRCKPLRECLLEVLKVQRELKRSAVTIKRLVKKEKELHKQWRELRA